jgi:hypothetical protein
VDIIDFGMLRKTRQLAVFLLALASTSALGCTSRSEACTVIQLQIDQPHRTLKTLGQSQIHVTCPIPMAEEILVEGIGYSLTVGVTPSQDPLIYLGLVPAKSLNVEITGQNLSHSTAASSFQGRISHFARLRDLHNGVLEFQVTDRMTRQATSYSWKVTTRQCTCRYYDGT